MILILCNLPKQPILFSYFSIECVHTSLFIDKTFILLNYTVQHTEHTHESNIQKINNSHVIIVRMF